MCVLSSLHNIIIILYTHMQYTINADNYFGNYLQTVKLSFLDDLRSLRQAVDKSVWLTPPTAVNAYYDPQFNEFGEPTTSMI